MESSILTLLIVSLTAASLFKIVQPLSIDLGSANENESTNIGHDTEELGRMTRQVGPSAGGDYADAEYAGKMALFLKDLEFQDKDVYTNFLSSGFTGDSVPRELPDSIKSLSRISSRSQLPESSNVLPSFNQLPSDFQSEEKSHNTGPNSLWSHPRSSSLLEEKGSADRHRFNSVDSLPPSSFRPIEGKKRQRFQSVESHPQTTIRHVDGNGHPRFNTDGRHQRPRPINGRGTSIQRLNTINRFKLPINNLRRPARPVAQFRSRNAVRH